MAFCAWSPGVRAQPDRIEIDESPFTHEIDEFVPGETITIHVFGVEDDVYDIAIIYNPGGVDLKMTDWEDETVPESGEIVLEYDIPGSATSLLSYEVQAWNHTGVFPPGVTYTFWVVLFDADIEVERDYYIGGEKVDVHYMCWYEKDYGPVTDGYIEWRAEDDATNTEIASDEIRINDADDAVGTFSFDLATGAATGGYTVEFWLNDTDSGTPDHVIYITESFRVETL
ncbi:MAG: hypothetical protein KAW84_04375, partial [Thermoplasmata archaeon]|nr:hypothetical protein [Thermoplasmata archaeon]